MGRTKKALLLCGLFLAVIAAGYANYAITAKKGDPSKKVDAGGGRGADGGCVRDV